VGTECVPLIAECLQLPLICKTLKGSSLKIDLHYETHPEDEVEDLFELLKEAKEKYAIEAVSVGAIFSHYQRIRVEHVCSRL